MNGATRQCSTTPRCTKSAPCVKAPLCVNVILQFTFFGLRNIEQHCIPSVFGAGNSRDCEWQFLMPCMMWHMGNFKRIRALETQYCTMARTSTLSIHKMILKYKYTNEKFPLIGHNLHPYNGILRIEIFVAPNRLLNYHLLRWNARSLKGGTKIRNNPERSGTSKPHMISIYNEIIHFCKKQLNKCRCNCA